MYAESESSRTHFEVFGLEGQVPGLEACKFSKMPCSRQGTALFFELLKMNHGHDLFLLYLGELQKPRGKFVKTFFSFFFGESLKFRGKFLVSGAMNFFCGEHLRVLFLGPWPWPGAVLSLALRGSVLENSVLGLRLGFCFESLASNVGSSTPPLYVWSLNKKTIEYIYKVKRNYCNSIMIEKKK